MNAISRLTIIFCALLSARIVAAETPPPCPALRFTIKPVSMPFPPKCFPGEFSMSFVVSTLVNEKGQTMEVKVSEISGLPKRALKCAERHFREEWDRARFDRPEAPCIFQKNVHASQG